MPIMSLSPKRLNASSSLISFSEKVDSFSRFPRASLALPSEMYETSSLTPF